MTVMARVQHQEWCNNEIIDAGDAIIFDCEPALDTFGFYKLPQTTEEINLGALSYGDLVARSAECLGLIEEWPGPFQLYIETPSEYEDYYARRMLLEG